LQSHGIKQQFLIFAGAYNIVGQFVVEQPVALPATNGVLVKFTVLL
jgi:hypothetical protein